MVPCGTIEMPASISTARFTVSMLSNSMTVLHLDAVFPEDLVDRLARGDVRLEADEFLAGDAP